MIGSKPRRLTMACTCIAVTTVVLTPMLAFAADDAVAGQHAFATHCASCHGVTTGAKKIGPTLAGVFGGPSGRVADFNYSPALKNAHLTWDSATLDKWLRNPPGLVHGTTMFASVSSSTDRQNLIAYLKTLSQGADASPASIK